jgi:5-methylcytosine-specific restriction endonuclease McrA
MKNKKTDAEHIWKQFEDLLVPRLRLSVTERAIYSHLLRHSHLEGRHRLRFSISWLARGVRLSTGPARDALRRLLTRGVLRLVQRSRAGHLIEVRLPEEIRAARGPAPRPRPAAHEAVDFLESKALRQAIHSRERGRCFYCLRRTTPLVRCLDHVVPLARRGRTSYKNLVSCCLECNSQKGERAAGDFLRRLYRERRLTAAELTGRLRALDALASGKLPPPLPAAAKSAPAAHTIHTESYRLV